MTDATATRTDPAITTRLARVVGVEDLHPTLRCITFGGAALASFTPAGPDTFLYVLLPPPGRAELTIDQSFTWDAYQEMPEAERPVGAYYTLRSWRPEATELDMHFVLHGDTGAASAWATRAAVGDPVALWGPRTAWHPPVSTAWYLLAADDTGLPAVARILEALPANATVRVFAEVEDEAHHPPLPETDGNVQITWLYRGHQAAGTTSLLVDAVMAADRPVGVPYAWGGGESHAMTAVRRHLRDTAGLSREQVSMVAYWRHQDHREEIDE